MIDKRFLTLAILSKNNSYTKTANQLFITQPAVSQQISSLENELDIQFVNNIHGKISLTDAGKKLAEFAWQTELEGQKVIDSLDKYDQSFSIGCTLSLSSTLLPKFIGKNTNKFKISTAEINNTQHVLQDIRNGKIDFGLIEGNFHNNEFDSIFIKNEEFSCVTYPDNAINSPTSMQSLLKQNILVREVGSGSREILENWLGTQNYYISDFQNTVEIASPSAIIELLKQKFGISFIYKSIVQRELENGELKEIDIQNFHITHPINLVYLKNSYFEAEYKKIAQFVME